LDDPEREQSLADLTARLAIPSPSVHREVERAEQAGIVRSRRVGRTRMVSADTTSPYFVPLRQLLVGPSAPGGRSAQVGRNVSHGPRCELSGPPGIVLGDLEGTVDIEVLESIAGGSDGAGVLPVE